MKTIITLFILCFFGCAQTQSQKEEKQPNFIVIFTDDQGYGDLGCFGGEHVNTPNIDRMATEGMKLTSFYVAAPVCTPSRAALMTGCYPKRNNMAAGVFLAGDSRGLHPDEITIAEVLKANGYATGIMGKWHLGDQPEFLPTNQGFDEFFGLPYSHDIHPWHGNNKKYNFPDLPLLDGEEVIEINPDMNYLTQRITDRAVAFITKNKDNPFFLYIPHPLPHRPVYASTEMLKQAPDSIKTVLSQENGTVNYALRDKIYPQAIGTIDASVGEILAALVENGLDKNTLVIFSSDNGPARGGMGSTGDLRGRKGQTLEGGMRMATIVWWPGMVPANSVCDKITTTMDLLPTFASLSGGKVPDDRIIDGKDISPLLFGHSDAKTPYEAFFYHSKETLQAVRAGKWKLHTNGELFNLDTDIGEKMDVSNQNPQVVTRLEKYLEQCRNDLENPDNCRPVGKNRNPKYLVPLEILNSNKK